MEQLCDEGLLGSFRIPMESLSLKRYYCSSVFFKNTKTCLTTFHEKFIADRSDPTLCEYVVAVFVCLFVCLL